MAKMTLITGPTEYAVDITTVREHSELPHELDNPQIERFIKTAQEHLELIEWRRYVTQTWDQYYDEFADPLELRYPPLSSVSSVKYTDTDGTLQTVADSVWEAAEDNGIGIVRRSYNQSWPVDVRAHPDSVVVQFVCGYGAASAVPWRVKQNIIVLATHFYQYRELMNSDFRIQEVPGLQLFDRMAEVG